MVVVVAGEVAGAGAGALGDEFEAAGDAVGTDDAGVEVDQVGIVLRRALQRGDAVRVVADGAGGFVVDDVEFVQGEGLIGAGDGKQRVAQVALVAEGVSGGGFGGLVGGDVSQDQEGLVARAVRALWGRRRRLWGWCRNCGSRLQ